VITVREDLINTEYAVDLKGGGHRFHLDGVAENKHVCLILVWVRATVGG